MAAALESHLPLGAWLALGACLVLGAPPSAAAPLFGERGYQPIGWR